MVSHANVDSVVGWRGDAMVGRRTCDQEVATREFDPRPGAAA